MARLRRVNYDSDHKEESPAQITSAPPTVAKKDKASATGAGSSAGPTVKHGVGKGLMVQPGLLVGSKKAALEYQAQEDKKKEEKKKEEDKKKKEEEKKKKKEEQKRKKRRNNEVGGSSTEPQKKKSRTNEVSALSEPPSETGIIPTEGQSMMLVDVSDSPEPVSERFNFYFQFKRAGKHIVEVPPQCSTFVRAIHGKVDLSSSSGGEVAEGVGYDHHVDFFTSIVRAMANYNQLMVSYDRIFHKALDYELELKQHGYKLVQSEKERTKLEEKLEQQRAFVVEANQMGEQGREESKVWHKQADEARAQLSRADEVKKEMLEFFKG